MAILAWTMMGIALWHFTVYFEERLAGGIIGAFVASTLGAVLLGWALEGFTLPSQDDTTIMTAITCIPGSIIGLALLYVLHLREAKKRPAQARRAA